jgi:hypothetical protein
MSFWGKGRAVLVALAAVSLLVLSGCGGDDSTAADPSAAASSSMVSREKFIEGSKSVCKKWRVKINRGLKNLYAKRSKETGEPLGSVGAIEAMRMVIVPSMKLELEDFEAVGLPRGEAFQAEAMWQAVRNMYRRVELEGMVAWTRESLIFPFWREAKPFGLKNCLYF